MTRFQAAKAVQRLNAIDAKCRSLYAERDQLEARVIEAVQASKAGALPISDGSQIVLRDNFQDRDGNPRNTGFKTCAIKRFEIQVK